MLGNKREVAKAKGKATVQGQKGMSLMMKIATGKGKDADEKFKSKKK